MSKVLVTEQYLTDIANAIRAKNSSTDKIKITDMADTITNIDTRKSITVIQKEHQTLTITSSGRGLSSSADTSGNTVYRTEYQDSIDISLNPDSGYNTGKITINGTEIEGSETTNGGFIKNNVTITNRMIISATDATLIPALTFTDVSLALRGSGQMPMFVLYGFQVKTQSPDTPEITYVTVNGKELFLGVKNHYSNCNVSITVTVGTKTISETVQLSYVRDIGMGADVVAGELSESSSLGKCLIECSTNKTECNLAIKVVP